MLFRSLREYGVKYTKEKRRLRVAYKIPWGIDFDVRNPGTCPFAGTWDSALELIECMWSEATQQERADFIEANPPTHTRN